MVLTEYDDNISAILNPYDVQQKVSNIPKIGITCFSLKLITILKDFFKGEIIEYLSNGNGKTPVYKIIYNEHEFCLFLSFVGSSACVVEYEEAYAMGIETIITFGTCGVLDKSISDLSIIIPISAVRDEGTSYHYIEASDEIMVNDKYKELFVDILKQKNMSYIEGKTWTTDAPYRETRKKVELRKKQGCICVEMECSALNSLSKFRNKELFQFFYAADNLDSTDWDKRSLGNNDKIDDKKKIGLLAVEFANKILDLKRRK